MRKRITQLVGGLLGLCICSMAISAKLNSVTIKNQQGKTSILCTLAGSARHKVFFLKQPNRVVIDFEHTTSAFDIKKLPLNSSLIRAARGGYPNPNIFRVVLEVDQILTLKTSSWNPSSGQEGLRIDLIPMSQYRSKAIIVDNNQVSKFSKAPVIAAINKKPVQVKHAPPHSLRDVIVVLDPGHGGKDPGAIGMNKSKEKHVVLAIAQKLKRLIDQQPGMHAVLTRNGDYYVGLRDRLNIARKYNADVFVAIHADAFANHNSNGASVFALSQRGATSEAARWLAEKENYSELGGVNLSDLDDRNGVIRTVLIDLSQTATIGASLHMGNHVLKNLDKMTNLHNNKVEQARFVVLKSPDIPSVLIETGFISNPHEERNLNNPAYQTRLTQAIFSGIKAYFWDYPPHGTRVEAMANRNKRIVRNQSPTPWG